MVNDNTVMHSVVNDKCETTELKDQTIKHNNNKSNRGRKKKVKSNDDTNKKMISLYIEKGLYDCLNIIKDRNKISISYICINAIKEHIRNIYPNIYYKLYDNKDNLILNINKDILNDYINKYVKDDDTIEANVIRLIVNRVLGINDDIDKKDINIEKEKLIDMFKVFVEKDIASTNKKDDNK